MLDGNRLGAAIAEAILNSRPSADSKISDSQLVDMWQLVGNEIVKEITENAIVNTEGQATVAGGSSAGSHPTVSIGDIT